MPNSCYPFKCIETGVSNEEDKTLVQSLVKHFQEIYLVLSIKIVRRMFDKIKIERSLTLH